MEVLELLLTDQQAAYLAGAYRVLHAAGEKKECQDVANVLLFFLKNLIIDYLKKSKMNPDQHEDWLAEIGAQLPLALRRYRPIHNTTLLWYSYNYLKKAQEFVDRERAKQYEHDVYDAKDEYLETISDNKKRKVKKTYEKEGKRLVEKKVVLSIAEAVRGNRALAELLEFDEE